MKILITLFLVFNVFGKKIDWTTFQGKDLVTSKMSEGLDKSKLASVFYFVSADCPCSNSYFEYLTKLKEKYPDFNYMGFHVGKGISKEKAKKYFSQYSIKFPILFDEDFKYADIFGALKTPHVFVVNKSGAVVFHGGVANSRHLRTAKKFYLENALSQIKGGNTPKLAHAKALGCYIQR